MQGVIRTNVAPMLAEPAAGSEQVSQALFGEMVRRVEEHPPYILVQTPDGYEGWVRGDSVESLPEGAYYPAHGLARAVRSLLAPVVARPRRGAERLMLLTPGARVQMADEAPASPGWLCVRLPCGALGYARARDLLPRLPARSRPAGRALRFALTMVGVPYLWGGKSTFGVDCSGLVQLAYQLYGIELPRDAHQQAACPGLRPVSPDRLFPGDLLFFAGGDDPRGRGITHVGMAMGDGRFVHACGGKGVIVTDVNEPAYKRMLHSACRVLSDEGTICR